MKNVVQRARDAFFCLFLDLQSLLTLNTNHFLVLDGVFKRVHGLLIETVTIGESDILIIRFEGVPFYAEVFACFDPMGDDTGCRLPKHNIHAMSAGPLEKSISFTTPSGITVSGLAKAHIEEGRREDLESLFPPDSFDGDDCFGTEFTFPGIDAPTTMIGGTITMVLPGTFEVAFGSIHQYAGEEGVSQDETLISFTRLTITVPVQEGAE